MRLLLTTILCLTLLPAFAQPCSCLDEFHFVKKHIETNHGGFNKKIGSPEEPAYFIFTQQLEKEIRALNEEKYCLAYLNKYILYLQDHHSQITGDQGIQVNEDDSLSLTSFFSSAAWLNTEKISPDSLARMIGKQNLYAPEGIYYSADSTYKVALLPSRTPNRDYAAYIMKSSTRLWEPGQVKFELKKVNDSLFDVFMSYRNHSIRYDQARFNNNRLLLNGWLRQGEAPLYKSDNNRALFAFREVDEQTVLIRIRSFDAGLTKQLDSFYRAIMPAVKKHKYLLIDVRDNGGGSDESYKSLMPLIYTDPYESDIMEYYATPDNIAAYQQYDSLLLIRSPGSNPPFKFPLSFMKKAAPYSFVHFGNSKPYTITYTKSKGYPEKVAVLVNRNCASSCESFLFEVMHSRKTIRVGENSGGYTGYGNVMTTPTPCGHLLSWTTTVYKEQWKYEFTGIPPQYRVPDDEKDWVNFARKILARD